MRWAAAITSPKQRRLGQHAAQGSPSYGLMFSPQRNTKTSEHLAVTLQVLQGALQHALAAALLIDLMCL